MKFNLSIPILSLLLPLCANAATSKKDFMQAMRSTQIQQQKRTRKQLLNKRLLSAAVKAPANANADKRRKLADDDDNANGDDNYAGYGFDMSTYSLKYAGCSSIATFSDDLAEDEDSETVFETDQYIMFRFCPTDSCSDSTSKGCMSDYGEYMVPIATWLEIIAEYREEEFERYCDYCDGCYGDDGNDGGNGNNYYRRKLEDGADADDGNDDGNADGDDNADDANANGDDAANADGDDGNADDGADGGDDNANAGDDDNEVACAYSSECSGYADVCENDNDADIDYSKFFECKEFDVSDDLVLYIGPRCASDKTSIQLGVFSDEYCTEYAGNKYDLRTITGEMLSTDSLSDYYMSDCIACKESVSTHTIHRLYLSIALTIAIPPEFETIQEYKGAQHNMIFIILTRHFSSSHNISELGIPKQCK